MDIVLGGYDSSAAPNSPIVAVAKAAASPNLSRQQCGPGALRADAVHQDVPVPQITLTANGNEINDLARWFQLELTRTPLSAHRSPEPLLRTAAGHILRATMPVSHLATAVLR
jgi:hypothetical protein